MSDSHTVPPPRRRYAMILIPVVAIAFLLSLGYPLYRFYDGGDPSALPSALIGKPVPEMKLPPLAELNRDGKPVPALSTADLKSGGVTVVNVFASWCGPCQDEHPELMKFAAMRKARLVGINYKDDPDNARRFLGTFGNPFDAVGIDPNGRSAIDWGVYGVPETFVVNGRGEIVEKIVGPLDDDKLAKQLLPAIDAASESSQ